MKKLIALLCMLTCIFSLTACGGAEELNVYQADKQANAEQYAVNTIVPLMTDSVAIPELLEIYDANGYTSKEWEEVIASSFSVSVNGDAYLKGLDSFLAGLEDMGGTLEVVGVSSKVDNEEIIVYVDVIGTLKDGQVEIILSNDYFTELKACTLNVDATFEELMTTAALNTLLGMGTVFAVLIFIMFLISAFAIIPKIQNAMANKGKKEAPKAAAPVAAPAAAVATAPAAKDDTELVAVIAAAVAAYRGETTTDCFVVRSIKKIKRR